MRVSLRTAVWPQLVAISLIGLGVAGCADTTRFSDLFGSTSSISPRSDGYGPGAQSAVETKPLPHLANVDDGASAYGRSAGGYQPDPNSAARTAPSYRSPAAATTHSASAVQSSSSTRHGGLVAPAVIHVVRAGQTLHSIAHIYHKPVTVIARANNLPVDARLKAGERITIPDIKEASQATPVRAEASAPPAGSKVAMADSSQTVRVVEPTPTMASQDAIKNAEPAGSLAGFRWPVRGRVIAAFGPKPNGVQNDGINLAVPEGTPIKAAEDGVVAYAGSELKGYGNLVLVRHPNGFVTAYAHASDILVKRGEAVKRGQVIGHAGQTGNVTSPQLHFEIRKGATPVDPAQYLNGA